MVAVAPPLLSDCPPAVRLRADLGDRFHYFRGRSGRRYLFSQVPETALADFRAAVVMLAEPIGRGRLAGHMLVAIDAAGRPAPGERPLPHAVASGSVCLVHLLAHSDAERAALVADLAAEPMLLAA